MIDTLLKMLGLLIAVLILWRTEPAINRMSHGTHWMVRYALLLIAAGGLALLLSTIAGQRPDGTTLILAAGIALMLLCERRLKYLLPIQPRRCTHNQPHFGDPHAQR